MFLDFKDNFRLAVLINFVLIKKKSVHDGHKSATNTLGSVKLYHFSSWIKPNAQVVNRAVKAKNEETYCELFPVLLQHMGWNFKKINPLSFFPMKIQHNIPWTKRQKS